MSILIKNIEIPKEIDPAIVMEFAVGIEGTKYARLYQYNIGYATEWHEIIEIPNNHRLIDADELIVKIQRYGVGSFDFEEDGYSPEQAERFVIRLINETTVKMVEEQNANN